MPLFDPVILFFSVPLDPVVAVVAVVPVPPLFALALAVAFEVARPEQKEVVAVFL